MTLNTPMFQRVSSPNVAPFASPQWRPEFALERTLPADNVAGSAEPSLPRTQWLTSGFYRTTGLSRKAVVVRECFHGQRFGPGRWPTEIRVPAGRFRGHRGRLGALEGDFPARPARKEGRD